MPCVPECLAWQTGARGNCRLEMEHAAKEFGIELWEHVGNVIQAMRRIAPELGLEGNIPRPQ
jgi:predicted hydrolase (HD superfamily)